MKFEKLKPGMVVFDLWRHKTEDSTISTISIVKVCIISIDPGARTATAYWNNNSARTYSESKISRWHEKEPLLIRSTAGHARRATRDEIRAYKATLVQEKQTRETDVLAIVD